MSDNNEPLDLQKIEARLAASNLEGREIRYMSAGEDPLIEIGFGPKPTKLENMTDLQEIFFINAPTDIAALVAEVKRLREREVNLLAWAKQRVKDYTYYGDDHFIGAHTMEEVVDYIETNGEGW